MWFLCDKVCQWLAAGRWFFQGTPVSSTNKTGRIKLTVMKQEVYCFVSTVGNPSYLTTSTLNTKYIWAVLIKLHDSHRAKLVCNFTSLDTKWSIKKTRTCNFTLPLALKALGPIGYDCYRSLWNKLEKKLLEISN
jgi:UDP-N-acetylglucosamine transferase subunit ALG13